MDRDERRLLDEVIGGDVDALGMLLERYRGLLYSVFHAPGFGFPQDYVDDLFQSFVVSLARNDFAKLRAFEGRNNCTLATYLQTVATRFTLDERRRWQRTPRAFGENQDDDEHPSRTVEDPESAPPDRALIDREQLETFHNLLFSIDWKRISAVLWVFRDVPRERIAEVMSTSRANIDALYKRAKDQMADLVAQGHIPAQPRRADPAVLAPAVHKLLRPLMRIPTRQLHESLLEPGAGRKALLGLVLVEYPRFLCSRQEIARIADQSEIVAPSVEVLERLTERLLTGKTA